MMTIQTVVNWRSDVILLSGKAVVELGAAAQDLLHQAAAGHLQAAFLHFLDSEAVLAPRSVQADPTDHSNYSSDLLDFAHSRSGFFRCY